RGGEWSGLDGEEFAPDKSAAAVTNYPAELLTIGVSGTSRRNGLGAIASEKNDCNFPQRRQPERIPRSDDSKDHRSPGPKDQPKQATSPSATVAQKPAGKPFRLDGLFQEGSATPTRVFERNESRGCWKRTPPKNCVWQGC